MNIKTKRIIISGNNYVSDNEIIKLSMYQDYPMIFKIDKNKAINNIKSNSFIRNVDIKRNIFGTLRIIVDERVPLFYSRDKKSIIFSDTDYKSDNNYGTPILINYVPDNYYERLKSEISKIDSSVTHLISEIEYSPWKNNDTIIDESRFLLRMNDGNNVYINLINFSKLNNYIEIYSTLEDKKGTLYLDSSSDKISFSLF